MKYLIICLLFVGSIFQGISQEADVSLTEIEVLGINYKYLNEIGNVDDIATPVKILERKAANFDIKTLDFYEDEHREYYVYFVIPQGKVLAVYNGDGEIIRTSEKFENIRLPVAVRNAIGENYPGWEITGDVYLVTYKSSLKNSMKRTYKLFIEKDGVRKRVKTNDKGSFI